MKTLILIVFFSIINTVQAQQSSNYLDVGISKTKLGLLLQNWALYDEKSTAGKSNFRFRRVEIKLSGTIQDNSSFAIMIDPAKSIKTGAVSATNDNKVLQDFVLNYNLNENFEFSTGQFKIPTTAEGLISSSTLILPERSLVGRTYGDKRDLGIKSTYKKANTKVALMISNGNKPNTDDTNTQKDLYLRGDYSPVKNLSLGAFSGLIDSKSSQLKWGLNLFWDNNPETLHFEYAHETNSPSSTIKKSNGYMFDLGYLLDPTLQLVIRYERLLFTRTTSLESTATTLGINYFLKDSNSKIQFATNFLNNMNASNGQYDVSTTQQSSAVLYALNFQMGF
jgi:phosphate-selective porin